MKEPEGNDDICPSEIITKRKYLKCSRFMQAKELMKEPEGNDDICPSEILDNYREEISKVL